MQNNNPILSIPYLSYDWRYDFLAVIEIVPGNSLYFIDRKHFSQHGNFFLVPFISYIGIVQNIPMDVRWASSKIQNTPPQWWDGTIFFITDHKLRCNSTKYTNGCTTNLVKNPKHTTTMVSRLPLWQHGFGESAHPTPGSCFGRVCPGAGLKGLVLFYCVAKIFFY